MNFIDRLFLCFSHVLFKSPFPARLFLLRVFLLLLHLIFLVLLLVYQGPYTVKLETLARPCVPARLLVPLLSQIAIECYTGASACMRKRTHITYKYMYVYRFEYTYIQRFISPLPSVTVPLLPHPTNKSPLPHVSSFLLLFLLLLTCYR